MRVRILLAATGREYECMFTLSASFRQNLSLLFQLLEQELSMKYESDGNECVRERDSGQMCDLYVSLRALNVQDGMRFIVC